MALADQALTLVAHETRISALEGELTGVKVELTGVEAQLERMHNLATLRDPIGLFRDILADRLGHISWHSMSSVMNCERDKLAAQQLTTRPLEAMLKEEGLSLAAWNDLKVVAAARLKPSSLSNQVLHQGKGIAPVLMLHEVWIGKPMPPDLAPQQQSVEQVLLYLHKNGYR